MYFLLMGLSIYLQYPAKETSMQTHHGHKKSSSVFDDIFKK